jgi:ubiquinone/menaquinone biosynthesis C-methylase UbiE
MNPTTTTRPDDAIQGAITRYWNDRASGYDQFQASQLTNDQIKAAWLAIWRGALPEAPLEVLDLGTGTGLVATLLAELGHRVTATDLAEDMLDRARANGAALPHPPTWRLGDAVAPDFPAASFDAITCRFLLWTLREPDRALANWRTLLRPGGTLAVVDGTHFPDGIHQAAADDGASAEFRQRYDRDVVAALPVAEARSIEATVDLLRTDGFADLEVTPLRRIEALAREFGTAPNHTVRLHHLIRARTR